MALATLPITLGQVVISRVHFQDLSTAAVGAAFFINDSSLSFLLDSCLFISCRAAGSVSFFSIAYGSGAFAASVSVSDVRKSCFAHCAGTSAGFVLASVAAEANVLSMAALSASPGTGEAASVRQGLCDLRYSNLSSSAFTVVGRTSGAQTSPDAKASFSAFSNNTGIIALQIVALASAVSVCRMLVFLNNDVSQSVFHVVIRQRA
jgi:hypothetical protein